MVVVEPQMRVAEIDIPAGANHTKLSALLVARILERKRRISHDRSIGDPRRKTDMLGDRPAKLRSPLEDHRLPAADRIDPKLAIEHWIDHDPEIGRCIGIT